MLRPEIKINSNFYFTFKKHCEFEEIMVMMIIVNFNVNELQIKMFDTIVVK